MFGQASPSRVGPVALPAISYSQAASYLAAVRTIKDIDESGCDLRLWCYACQHSAVVDGIIWMEFEEKGWALDVASARQRFKCRRCGSKDVLLTATKARRRSWKAQVEAFFHGNRKKKR